MKEQTRYRVTGSLFLLALAVICLPMLLDGAGVPARSLPDLSMAAELPEVAPVAGPAGGRRPEADPEERLARLREQVQPLREEVDDEGFLTRTGTRFGEPVLTPADADTEVWAVQVASFEDADNARAFRARLRDDGYESFLSTIRVAGPAGAGETVLSRVAVGPLLDGERAEILKDELSGRYSVSARLMAFSN